MNAQGMVIVGAGEAGARAALTLRSLGWTRAITLVGDESRPPYERPPLSKRHLVAEEELPPSVIADDRTLHDSGIERIGGEAAVRIDRENHLVELAGGRKLPYERLLLATGARPRPLPAEGTGAGELLYLRRFEDAERLRGRLRPGARAVIIGGGFIGLETAASAAARGCTVTLLEAAPRLLTRGVPQALAERVERLHRQAGVEVRLGAAVAAIDRAGDGLAIRLTDGTELAADVALAGIGAVPETALAASCGLELDNGVKADARLATSDPDIYAAGDCCSFPHPLYGGRRIRLEAWRNAKDQGAHAAAAMLGSDESYAALPWFWSDQYDQTLLVAGLAEPSDTVVLRDLGEAGRLYFHLGADGRLSAVSGMGPGETIAKPFRQAELLAEKRAAPPAEQLADPRIKLKTWLSE